MIVGGDRWRWRIKVGEKGREKRGKGRGQRVSLSSFFFFFFFLFSFLETGGGYNLFGTRAWRRSIDSSAEDESRTHLTVYSNELRYVS